MPGGADRLSPLQRDLLACWLPGVEVEEDLSWDLVETTVLKATAGHRAVIVKAGGTTDRHLAREIDAHERWTRPWVRAGRAARMLHADREAKLLVTEYLPGRLAQDDPAAAQPGTYRQAGELLAALHAQEGVADAAYEEAANAKALAWLDAPHRIAPEDVARLRGMIRAWPAPPVVCVPTHGDWQGRNWLIGDDGVLRVIDFGRAALRPAAEDLERLATREFARYPGAERAFLDGYGQDPREPEAWFRQRVRAAIGTACWAHRVGDASYEAEGHRWLADLLTGS